MEKQEFVRKLEAIKEELLRDRERLKGLNSETFEEIVAEYIRRTIDEKALYIKGSSRFPDIGVPPFGVEVKFTKADKWGSTGNSILESSRWPDVNSIYVIFLKAGGIPDISIRPYEDVMTEIVVTHSPRYMIDMRATTSIFQKMRVSYDEFRSNDPIGKAKKYYSEIVKKSGGCVWWLDERKGESAPPVLRMYGDISADEKRDLIVELMALFPELIREEASPTKYDRATLFLVSRHNVLNRSLRDMFSAGGRRVIPVDGKEIEVSRAIGKLYELAENIKTYICSAEDEILGDCWNHDVTNMGEKERIDHYKSLLSLNIANPVEGITASRIFQAGLAT